MSIDIYLQQKKHKIYKEPAKHIIKTITTILIGKYKDTFFN